LPRLTAPSKDRSKTTLAQARGDAEVILQLNVNMRLWDCARLILTIGGLTLCSGCARQTADPPGEIFDAGDVFCDARSSVQHVFIIPNTTAHPVKLIEETHSCTCTTADIELRSLQPGESTPLSLRVPVPSEYRSFSASAIVKTDAPDHSDWRYELRFQAYPPGRLLPDRIDLGSWQHSNGAANNTSRMPPTIFLEVFKSPNDKTISRFQIRNPAAEVEVQIGNDPAIDLLSKSIKRLRYPVTLRLRGPLNAGHYARAINIQIGASMWPARALITWNVSGPITSNPSCVSFGSVRADSGASRALILIKSKDRKPFVIKNIKSDSPLVVGREQETAISHAIGVRTVELLFRPPNRDNRKYLSGIIRINTNVDGATACQVGWAAFISN
jgi:hypothetical protein